MSLLPAAAPTSRTTRPRRWRATCATPQQVGMLGMGGQEVAAADT